MKKISLWAILILMGACVPTGGERKQYSRIAPEVRSNLPNNQEIPSEDQLYWFTHQKEKDFAHLFVDSLSPLFLQGSSVSSFLNDKKTFKASYCLTFKFPDSSPKTQLRMRAVPVELFLASNGEKRRLFRLEPANTSDNTSLCGGSVNGINATLGAYHPYDLCQGENCPRGTLTSSKAQLWLSSAGELTSPITQINLRQRGIHLHQKTPNQESQSKCTNASCKALGFDCCLPHENQCINDAQLRPNASFQLGFDQAQAQVAKKPNSYVNWPEIYFICPQGAIISNPNEGDEVSGTPVSFQELLNSYLCQNATPEEELDICRPDKSTVVGEIQVVCGCPTPNTCPHLKYDALKNERQQIINIFCSNNETPPPLLQDQKVIMSSRSVPHRFFRNSDGKAVDDFLSLQGSSEQQEGQDFFYLDEKAKRGPQNGLFNMNSVLGRMSLSLDQARPAKMVPVEFDKIYIIGATSGSSIPCPLCPKDQWLNLLSPHPSFSGVDGLIAVGHSTRRDDYQQNNTYGNFEDTKFGRACWIPPTMIPFSHKPQGNMMAQRLHRLETQAAFYINGYQRDWFGLNKGAVIGSFDGVTWFAIGNGRRVQAKGNKLFLAINAPFGDLASNHAFEISIREDTNGLGETPDYDFDPSITDSNSAHYNQAASCQQYHQCQVDTDCVTQLGWEYLCADVSQWKTLLPQFNLDAREQSSSSVTRTKDSFPVGGLPPEDSTKRCVYRGMGALCQQNLSTPVSKEQKLLTCAPNFYCADLSSSNFNGQLAREPNALFNILYGFEADVLGRPARYVGAAHSLPTSVQDNINANFSLIGSGTSSGLCLPGKNIEKKTFLAQHQEKDPNSPVRTDFISQIGPCNPSVPASSDASVSVKRVLGCPLFDEEGDYIFTTDTTLDENLNKFLTQNSCGNSGRKSPGNIEDNAFSSIEARGGDLTYPTHGEHACLRRAGSPCFTDMDCTPSRLHAETAAALGLDYFGGTQAEKNYWTESLICGQAQEKPIFGTPKFQDYDITQNRCCRAAGLSLSITGQRKTSAEDTTRPIGDLFPMKGYSQARRYSRFMTIYEHMISTPYQQWDPVTSPCTRGAGCRDGEFQDITANDQWKAPHKVASRTCCGGGWVRKFSDGTHNWNQPHVPLIDVLNFQCLNYRNEYLFRKPTHVSTKNYNADVAQACRETGNSGCPQINFPIGNGMEIIEAPALNRIDSSNNPSERITGLTESHTVPNVWVTVADYSSLNDNGVSNQGPSFLGEDLQNLDKTNVPGTTTSIVHAGIFAPSGLRHKPPSPNSNRPWLAPDLREVEYWLPAYINVLNSSAHNNLVSIGVSYAKDPESFSDFTRTGQFWTRASTNPKTSSALARGTQFTIEVSFDSSGNHVLKISCGTSCHPSDFTHAWPVIEFVPQGTPSYRETVGGNTVEKRAFSSPTHFPFSSLDSPYGMMPGDGLYYLSKLGRLELLGVPEIHFEPLYCNTNMNKLLPGLYTYETRNEVENTSRADGYESLTDPDIVDFDASGGPLSGDTWVAGQDNPNHFVLTQKEIDQNPVFSEDELVCCSPLGTPVSSPERCCTHYSREIDGKKECALPSKIDLMVYFNRFISGEGRFDPEKEPDGLKEEDFNPKTGEPKLRQSTYDKIRALGQKYCDYNDEGEKTRTGAAMGYYVIEPIPDSGQVIGNGPQDPGLRRYGLVDSLNDSSNDRQKGYNPFQEGFRWNHHLYCR